MAPRAASTNEEEGAARATVMGVAEILAATAGDAGALAAQPTESAHSSSIGAGGLRPTTRWPGQVGPSGPQLPSMPPSRGPLWTTAVGNSCMLASPSSSALPRFRLRRCRDLPFATVCFSASFCTGAGSTDLLPRAAEVSFGKALVVDASTAAAARVNPSAARRRRSASLLTCMATPAAEWTARPAPRAA